MLRDTAAFTPPSRRLRFFVYLSVLLLLFVGVAQAAHSHGSWNSAAHVRASNDAPRFAANDSADADPGCLLCVISHSALPSFAVLVGQLDFAARFVSPVFRSAHPRLFWSYDLFSRPPPQA